MAAQEFLEVASYANAFEADLVRSMLDENGIQAIIEGAEMNTFLSHIGSALGGVKVLVRNQDLTQAQQILANQREAIQHPSAGWFCNACQEEIEPGFDVCWSCGQSREEVAGQRLNSMTEPEIEPASIADFKSVSADASRRSDEMLANPYAAPSTPLRTESTDESVTEINPRAEDLLLRAWRASIIGLMLLPVVAHIYSMYLLLRASMMAGQFSPTGQRRFFWSFVLNILATLIWAVLFGFLG